MLSIIIIINDLDLRYSSRYDVGFCYRFNVYFSSGV